MYGSVDAKRLQSGHCTMVTTSCANRSGLIENHRHVVWVQLSHIEGDYSRTILWPIDHHIVDFRESLGSDSSKIFNVFFDICNTERVHVFDGSPKADNAWNIGCPRFESGRGFEPVSYTHLRAHETDSYLVCRLLL